MSFRFLIAVAIASAVAVVFAGCDAAPGPDALDAAPPVVADLQFTPAEITFEELPQEQIISDTLALVPVTISVRLSDTDGRVDSVVYSVLSPYDNNRRTATGRLERNGDRYEARPLVQFRRSDIGKHTVQVYAVDQRGHLSNQVRGQIEFKVLINEPPEIVDVEAPERVQRPAEGQPPTLIKIVAEVTHPFGLSNISRVILRTAGGQEFHLLDDGGENPDGTPSGSGDDVAGDGRYTITLQLTHENQPGPNRFEFQAYGRGGLKSNLVERTIIVE